MYQLWNFVFSAGQNLIDAFRMANTGIIHQMSIQDKENVGFN